LGCARYGPSGVGTQNAGLAAGGYGGGNNSVTEEYNGTSWSAGGSLINARRNSAGAGTHSAGLAFGGNNALSCTEEYNKSLGIVDFSL
jgi:hypothetical protein